MVIFVPGGIVSDAPAALDFAAPSLSGAVMTGIFAAVGLAAGALICWARVETGTSRNVESRIAK